MKITEAGTRAHSEETRDRMSLDKGGNKFYCYPLFLRGGTNLEVAHIRGFTRLQVEQTRQDLREEGLLPRPSKEEEKEAKRRAHTGKPRLSDREYSEEEKISAAFAKTVQDRGWITPDLSNWQSLHEFYRKHDRKLPDSFPHKIGLEAFFKVRTAPAEEQARLKALFYRSGTYVHRRQPYRLPRVIATEIRFIGTTLEKEVRRQSAVTPEARDKYSEAHGSVRIKAYPFLVRQIPIYDIVRITGLESRAISDVKLQLTREGVIPEGASDERVSPERAYRKNLKKIDEEAYSKSEENRLAFAKALWKAGLVRKDTDMWDALHAFFRMGERKLPAFAADKLHLEVFLAAQIALKQGNSKPFEKFVKIGERLDIDWYEGDEFFENRRFIHDSFILARQGVIFQRK